MLVTGGTGGHSQQSDARVRRRLSQNGREGTGIQTIQQSGNVGASRQMWDVGGLALLAQMRVQLAQARVFLEHRAALERAREWLGVAPEDQATSRSIVRARIAAFAPTHVHPAALRRRHRAPKLDRSARATTARAALAPGSTASAGAPATTAPAIAARKVAAIGGGLGRRRISRFGCGSGRANCAARARQPPRPRGPKFARHYQSAIADDFEGAAAVPAQSAGTSETAIAAIAAMASPLAGFTVVTSGEIVAATAATTAAAGTTTTATTAATAAATLARSATAAP